MQRQEYPYKTTMEALSVFDRANQYRPLHWLDAANQIDWLNQVDNGALLTLLEILPGQTVTIDQPYTNWTEDSRLDIGSQFTVAATASDTIIKIDDPYIVGINNILVSTSDSEAMRVTAVNYDLALTDASWKNGAGTVGNLRVERGIGGTAAVAKLAKSYVTALPKPLAEQEDPKIGVGQLPGLKQFQYATVWGQTIKVTKRQENTMVYDNWGQLSRAQVEAVLDVRRKLGKAYLFAPRFTKDMGSDGQLYVGGGLVHFIKSNVIDLGTQASNHTWSVYNEFLWNLFRADASSNEKILLAGETLYSTLLRMSRATNTMVDAPYWEPSLKADTFRMVTDEGHSVVVIKDRFGLAANEGLADWGFVLDRAHIGSLSIEGFDWQWVQNIQDPRSIQVREDAYWGSGSIIVKHESTHGIIRGATGRIVNQR